MARNCLHAHLLAARCVGCVCSFSDFWESTGDTIGLIRLFLGEIMSLTWSILKYQNRVLLSRFQVEVRDPNVWSLVEASWSDSTMALLWVCIRMVCLPLHVWTLGSAKPKTHVSTGQALWSVSWRLVNGEGSLVKNQPLLQRGGW